MRIAHARVGIERDGRTDGRTDGRADALASTHLVAIPDRGDVDRVGGGGERDRRADGVHGHHEDDADDVSLELRGVVVGQMHDDLVERQNARDRRARASDRHGGRILVPHGGLCGGASGPAGTGEDDRGLGGKGAAAGTTPGLPCSRRTAVARTPRRGHRQDGRRSIQRIPGKLVRQVCRAVSPRSKMGLCASSSQVEKLS